MVMGRDIFPLLCSWVCDLLSARKTAQSGFPSIGHPINSVLASIQKYQVFVDNSRILRKTQ